MNYNQSKNKFSNPDFLPEGWFWLEQSKKLKKNKAIPIDFFNKKLVLFRTETNEVHALDAHCPHMGAHLCDGKVEGNGIRCPFHNWKFDSKGECVDIPVQDKCDFVNKLNSYPVKEHFGLIWLWTGDKENILPLPVPEELEDLEVSTRLGKPFEKKCHPNVVMINAIDAHHFTSVHNLVVKLNMAPKIHSQSCISFANTTPCPEDHILFGKLKWLYKNALTYKLQYWWGNVGAVTVGPDFLHMYIMFVLRPGKSGDTQGQAILLTKKRKGLWGRIANPILLYITKIFGNYFAKGDTLIFEKINFDFQHPILADKAIVHFIKHFEQQPASTFHPSEKLARTTDRNRSPQPTSKTDGTPQTRENEVFH